MTIKKGDSILATYRGMPIVLICERDMDGIIKAKSACLRWEFRIRRDTWIDTKERQARRTDES